MLDLSDDLGFTFDLLVDTRAWKHRVVEQVTLGSETYYKVQRTYQIELPPALLEAYDGNGDARERVRVLLPLTALPKAPLLSFDLTGPDGNSAPLELRRSGAAVQAAFLAHLAAGDNLRQEVIDTSFSEGLLEAICAFTPAYFEELLDDAGDIRTALAVYLQDGLGFPVPSDLLDEAMKFARWSAKPLQDALGEPPHLLSSSENVLLALPLMDTAAPRSAAETVEIARRYHGGVAIAAAIGATNFLSTLGEYGCRWEALTEVELKTGTPNLVKVVDRRPLNLDKDRLRSGVSARFDIALGEGASYHLAVGTDDEALRMVGWTAEEAEGTTLPPAVLEGARRTPELITLYSSVEERPYLASVVVRIKAAPSVRLVSFAVSALSVASVVGACFGSSEPDRLGVLAVPTTFAVALLQFRERVSLLTRLQRGWSRLMLLSLVLLWAVVIIRLLGE
jgi:hypothetical protein